MQARFRRVAVFAGAIAGAIPPDTAPRIPPPSITSATRAPGGRSRSAVITGRAISQETHRFAATMEGDGRAAPHPRRQVLANLLGNAIVHTPPGTPVEVKLEREGDEISMRVRDHGPGLPTDEADTVFDRFWRAEAGRERGRAGAGLGLAIVAGIAEAHDGRVEAANAPGGGACFTVQLPAAASAPTATPDSIGA